MDILITFVIVAVIGLSIVPFFLLGGAFKPKAGVRGRDNGSVTPVPTGTDGPIFPKKINDSGPDDLGDADGDGDGGLD